MSLGISISNSIQGFRSSGGGGGDSDAQAFITAASITDPTQQSAINQLVVDLKGYSIWTKMKALYPFVGGTASAHKFNLKDPQDTDAAFRLVFNGGWTHSSTGATPNGTNGWADTFVKTGTDLALNSTHVSVYSRTNNSTGALAIGNCFGGGNFELSIFLKNSANNTTHRNNTSSFSQASNLDSRGFYIGNRNSSTQQKIIKNTTINTFNVNSIATTNSFTINISSALQSNSSGVRAYYDDKQLAFSSIGDGLTDTEAANFYTAVQAFQTTLGRSIGTQTVSDPDAQAFVTNAGIVDQVEANAINNLVIGLKADGLWTKMDVIYPMVGSTATSNSYNLKNTATNQLTFSGGWTHSSTGAKPNGTNAYANTGYNPSITASLNSHHLSYYSRTNSNGTEVEIGTYPGGSYDLLELRTSGTTYFLINQNGTTSSFSDSNSQGFYIGNRTASNVINGWKNGSKVVNSSVASNILPNGTLFLGALNQGGALYYSTKECAFSTIGQGLTDTDATNLNTRVTTFQTALNRNV